MIGDDLGTQSIERMVVKDEIVGQTDEGSERENDGGEAVDGKLDPTGGSRASFTGA